MAAHSPEESAIYILTIFIRLRCMQGQTVLMNNLDLPFKQDGWTPDNLAEGLACGVEKGWIEIGKGEKFVKMTEAGYAEAKGLAVALD